MKIAQRIAQLSAFATQPGDFIMPSAPASSAEFSPTLDALAAQFRFPVVCAVAPPGCMLRPLRLGAGSLFQVATDCTIASCVLGATIGLLAINRTDSAKELLGANILPVVTLIGVSAVVTSVTFGVIGYRALGFGSLFL